MLVLVGVLIALFTGASAFFGFALCRAAARPTPPVDALTAAQPERTTVA
jgi:hypothetical protein